MKVNLTVILISIFGGLLVWVTDSALDALYFSKQSFEGLLITDIPQHKLFIRISLILYFFLFSSLVTAYAKRQKKTEEKLEDSKVKFKNVTEQTYDWVFWRNTDGSYKYISSAFERITGYLREELVRDPSLMKKIIHPDDYERFKKHFEAETTNSLEISQLDFKILTQNREEKTIRHSCQPIFDENGRFIGTRGSNVEVPGNDITNIKAAEESLKNSEERLKILFEHAPDAYYLIDLKGNILDGNKAAEEMIGYKREELIGKNIFKMNLISSKQILKAVSNLAKNATGKSTGPDEFTLIRKNKEQIITEIRTYPVKIGGKIQILSIARDITARRMVEAEVQKKSHQLGEQAKELNCLYEISRKMVQPNCSIEEIMQATMDVLLSSWQYPEITGARLTYNGSIVKSDNWKETEWIQSADIVNVNGSTGRVEVCYTKEKPELDEGPFVNEERNLIDAIGILLGDFIQKKEVESSLTECIAGLPDQANLFSDSLTTN